MGDVSKQRLSGPASRVQAETERAFSRVRRSIEDLDAEQVAYAPGTPADWASPQPTTVQEALDRLAAAGGTTPVP